MAALLQTLTREGRLARLPLTRLAPGEVASLASRLSPIHAQPLAEMLGTRHLAAQIRLWLVPLLPPAEARLRLAEARAIAESGRRRRLLEEVARLEEQLPAL